MGLGQTQSTLIEVWWWLSLSILELCFHELYSASTSKVVYWRYFYLFVYLNYLSSSNGDFFNSEDGVMKKMTCMSAKVIYWNSSTCVVQILVAGYHVPFSYRGTRHQFSSLPPVKSHLCFACKMNHVTWWVAFCWAKHRKVCFFETLKWNLEEYIQGWHSFILLC